MRYIGPLTQLKSSINGSLNSNNTNCLCLQAAEQEAHEAQQAAGTLQVLFMLCRNSCIRAAAPPATCLAPLTVGCATSCMPVILQHNMPSTPHSSMAIWSATRLAQQHGALHLSSPHVPLPASV